MARLHAMITKFKTQLVWQTEDKEVFETIKQEFNLLVPLQHPDVQKPFVLETDASNVAIGAVLKQFCDQTKKLRPVGFLSQKLTAHELNYSTFEKELYAIIRALLFWRHFLEPNPHKTTIYTDHKNLCGFQRLTVGSARLARWRQTLDCFNIQLVYCAGIANGWADFLS